MSGITSASGVIAARAALFAAFQAALAADDDVDLYTGFQWPITKNCWAALTTTENTPTPKNSDERSNRQQVQEDLSFGASIGAWVPGQDKSTEAFDRAFGILATVEKHIVTTDRTLGGTVLWCNPGPSQSDGAEDADGSGYTVEIAATFLAAHRVRYS